MPLAIHQLLLEVHINAFGLDRSYEALNPLEVQTDFIRIGKIFDANQLNHSTESSIEMRTRPYNGQYDNLFFFFVHMYRLIHKYYDHNLLQAYKRPIK